MKMLNFIKKLVFFVQKPPVVLITGREHESLAKAVAQVLESSFKIRKVSDGNLPFVKSQEEILIFETEAIKPGLLDNLRFFLRKSRLPVLVVTHLGDIPPERYFFAGDRKKSFPMRKIAEVLPARGFSILNFDDETVREIENETIAKTLTFGFQKRADLQATDLNLSIEGMNFKLNYQGYTIPFWLDKIFGKAHIYQTLAAAGVALALGINLVEVSQSLKDYSALPGKMRLIKGVKKSFILDDSKSATVYSMMESLDILKEIGKGRRKIAVLGDVVGVGKYTPEAHEAIGEKVAQTADLLFAVGVRAIFISQGAKRKGMKENNIFEFDTAREAKGKVQEEIRKDDLILIDGSKEMKMEEIVDEIKQ